MDLRDQLQSTLGHAYRIDRELSGGAMSRVLVARDNTLGRDVVIKVLSPELAGSFSTERFRREIELAARLQPGLERARRELARLETLRASKG